MPPPAASCSCSLAISAVSSRIRRLSSLASFLFFVLVIFLARCAYLSVAKLSRKLRASGETVASITVTVLPPSDSSSRRVSFEERYGTWMAAAASPLASAPPRAVPPLGVPFPAAAAPSVRALITLPSAERLLLMAAPSWS